MLINKHLVLKGNAKHLVRHKPTLLLPSTNYAKPDFRPYCHTFYIHKITVTEIDS